SVRSLLPGCLFGVPSTGIYALALVSLILGCDEPEPIRTYVVSTTRPVQLQPQKTRMLAAMIPVDQTVWFFKVTGPESDVGTIEEPFEAFAKQVPIDETPDLSELPEGWKQAPGGGFRFATVNIETPGKQLEMSVSKLRRMDDYDRMVSMNVNRWRGQLSLEDSDEPMAGGEPLDRPDKPESIWVDILGSQDDSKSMRAPFAGGNAPFASRAAPFASGSTNGELPPDHPPISPPGNSPRGGSPKPSSNRGQPPSDDGPLAYDVPEGWRPGRMNSFRIAAFEVGPEDASAEMTAIFAGGDLRSNVVRWMGQVLGDTPSDDLVEQAMADAIEVNVDGKPGKRFILKGNADSKISIDGTLVPPAAGSPDQMTLFLKMTGPPGVVDEQFKNVEKFIQSIKVRR
ncbi:MAG: hypothetical protein AAF664_23305, partial [Planctomycetota bacterium]